MRPLYWVGDSHKRFSGFPAPVQDDMGFALLLAQEGRKHPSAKPLKGFGGAGVLEIAERHGGNAYRAVYTVKFPDAVYVLHAFQKKSRRGIQTPREEMEVAASRLRALERELGRPQ